MQRVIYYVASSVDGFIQPENGGFESYSTNPDLVAEYIGRLRELGSVIMGRKTYEFGLKQGVVDPYPWLRTFVVSRTLPNSESSNVEIVREDPIGFLRKLRSKEGKGIYLCGGGDFAAQVIDADLLDELLIKLSPILVGSGVRLIDRVKDTFHMKLRDTKRYADGAVLLEYERRTRTS